MIEKNLDIDMNFEELFTIIHRLELEYINMYIKDPNYINNSIIINTIVIILLKLILIN